MAFFGNFAAARGAAAIGQYQKSIWDNEAKYITAQRDQKAKVFDEVLKPQLVDIHKTQYSDFFVKNNHRKMINCFFKCCLIILQNAILKIGLE